MLVTLKRERVRKTKTEQNVVVKLMPLSAEEGNSNNEKKKVKKREKYKRQPKKPLFFLWILKTKKRCSCQK
jgi:hypothetical protein